MLSYGYDAPQKSAFMYYNHALLQTVCRACGDGEFSHPVVRAARYYGGGDCVVVVVCFYYIEKLFIPFVLSDNLIVALELRLQFRYLTFQSGNFGTALCGAKYAGEECADFGAGWTCFVTRWLLICRLFWHTI